MELLQKLLNDEIRSRSRTNVVIEKKFSERLQAASTVTAVAQSKVHRLLKS